MHLPRSACVRALISATAFAFYNYLRLATTMLLRTSVLRATGGMRSLTRGAGSASLLLRPQGTFAPDGKQRREMHGFFAAAAAEPAVAAAAVAAPLVGPAAVSFLSVSPGLAAQVLFLSPMQAMKQFREAGTTGDVSVMPYAAMAANGAAWCTYGALGSDLAIMLPNASGLVFGLYYCQQFYTYRDPNAMVLPYFGGGAAFAALAVGAAATMPALAAKTVIGYAGCTLTALMFYGPLASINTVLRDRSAASLPLAFTLASTANCTLWTSYGALVIHDPFVFGPNGVGLCFSFVQLGLIARFGTAAATPSADVASSKAGPKADETAAKEKE